MKEILQDYGKTIRFLRNGIGISQEKLAGICDFHRTYIGQIERGERNPSLTNIKKFADAFGMTLSEFFLKCERLKQFGNDKI